MPVPPAVGAGTNLRRRGTPIIRRDSLKSSSRWDRNLLSGFKYLPNIHILKQSTVGWCAQVGIVLDYIAAKVQSIVNFSHVKESAHAHVIRYM